MFGVKWIGGVYASMSHVAMTLEEAQNILKTIKEILHLGESIVITDLYKHFVIMLCLFHMLFLQTNEYEM